jgi:nucleoid-associated protein YgaU
MTRDNFHRLLRVIYGRGVHYRVIFAANKNQIRNPDRIYPGQIFTIPNAFPPESIDPKRRKPLTPDEGAGTLE